MVDQPPVPAPLRAERAPKGRLGFDAVDAAVVCGRGRKSGTKAAWIPVLAECEWVTVWE